jgi:Zn-dependent protease with chaperone function
VLTIGLPLWETLDPGQRLALLGHEFAHGAAGDTRETLWVRTAVSSLDEWYTIFRPGHRSVHARGGGGGGGAVAIIGEMVAMVVLGIFAELTILLNRSLSRLTILSGRRAEYLADELAARIAGRDKAAEMLAALTLGSSTRQVIRQRQSASASRRRRAGAAQPAARADFWTDLRSYVASIPENERARRLLVSELDDSAVDSTHPPTHLRIAFVRRLPAAEPAFTLNTDELAAVDKELAKPRAAVAGNL